mmetsp:Transcript_23571/g.62070  ORF Transcript_23571/g.62070 Transcript_23571/m.62070 type:complete len:221 (-) Transcript_23571:560-1222(-)
MRSSCVAGLGGVCGSSSSFGCLGRSALDVRSRHGRRGPAPGTTPGALFCDKFASFSGLGQSCTEYCGSILLWTRPLLVEGVCTWRPTTTGHSGEIHEIRAGPLRYALRILCAVLGVWTPATFAAGSFDFRDTASAGDASTLAGSRVCQRQGSLSGLAWDPLCAHERPGPAPVALHHGSSSAGVPRLSHFRRVSSSSKASHRWRNRRGVIQITRGPLDDVG